MGENLLSAGSTAATANHRPSTPANPAALSGPAAAAKRTAGISAKTAAGAPFCTRQTPVSPSNATSIATTIPPAAITPLTSVPAARTPPKLRRKR